MAREFDNAAVILQRSSVELTLNLSSSGLPPSFFRKTFLNVVFS